MPETIGTPLSPSALRVMLLGSGELGKEVAIELQRFGCEVIACDSYANAPAMQVAHRNHVFSMLDGATLRQVVESERPDVIVPEIEAIATAVLVELEAEGFHVVPSARATQLTMNREGIRTLAAETLGLPTSPFRFVNDLPALMAACGQLGWPCVIKPLMSSSGKGQSVMKSASDAPAAWAYAQSGSRSGAGRCIVEGWVPFDCEITVLTVSAVNGLHCCPAIGHIQIDGDYRESWQPIAMPEATWLEAQRVAKAIVSNLGGFGIFGVELFVVRGLEGQADRVIFSEVSPRPHDTGLVTLGSQQLSEFALHVRAILGFPVPEIRLLRAAASVPLLGNGHGIPVFRGLPQALAIPESQIRLFGKPVCLGHRRLAVAVAAADTVEEARVRAQQMAQLVTIEFPSASSGSPKEQSSSTP
jgi:phosphoribosylglycinamide formyltransferase 2